MKKGQGEILVISIVGIVILLLFSGVFYFIYNNNTLGNSSTEVVTAEPIINQTIVHEVVVDNVTQETKMLPTESLGNPSFNPPKGGCKATSLPDSRCTPGSTFNVSLDVLCTTGYTDKVRYVTEDMKATVRQIYGISIHSTEEYEIDHLIPLELGGDNSLANLWPQTVNPPGYKEKDIKENQYHKAVCDGTMLLSRAQEVMKVNWLFNG